MASPTVVIRKYSDRRLYDPGASRYVKLDDIARLVREGTDVKVLDARSGKDLTSTILTQIIVEDARNRDTALPIQLLQQLIRASDRATHDFVTWYLNNTLQLYHKAQETVQSRLTGAKTAVSSPLEFVRQLVGGQSLPSSTDAAEADKLRRRVEELEAQLAELAKTKRTARRRRPSTRRKKANGRQGEPI
jgi:polyhydroxyalkanoate synthesis repressor PhaR